MKCSVNRGPFYFLPCVVLPSLALWWLAPATPTQAQTALDELERRLESAPDPAPPRQPGYLGLVADNTLAGGGVRVTAVYTGAPASLAGIEAGDIITSIGGAEIRSLDDMGRELAAFEAGRTIQFEVRRGIRKLSLRVTLGRRPGAATAPVVEARPSLGVEVVPLTAEARGRYGLAVAQGALVAKVQRGSAGAQAGVVPGAAIVAIDGRRIDSAAELASNVAAMRVGQEVELTYYVGDLMYRKRAKLTPAAAAGPSAPFAGADAGAPPAPEGLIFPDAAPPPAAPREELAGLKREMTLLKAQMEDLQRRISALEARIGEE